MSHDGAVATVEPVRAAPILLPRVSAPGVPAIVKWPVLAGAGLSLLIAVGMAARVTPIGSHAGRFWYKYIHPFSWQFVWPAAAVLATVLGLLWLTRRTHRRFEWATVLGWVIAAAPLQLLLRWYAHGSVSDIVVSDRSNSFYSPTLRWSALEFISRYMDINHLLPAHAGTNMPGKSMLYYLLGLVTESPAIMGIAVMVVANLGAVLAYLIVRDWLHDRRAAVYAVILYLLMPGLVFFTPVLNVVSPVPILLALWLHVRFLKTRHWAYPVLLGPTLYLTFFFEPTPLALGLVFAGMLAVAWHRGSIRWPDVARLVIITLAAFAACYLLMRAIFGYDLIANLAFVLQDATDYNVGRRPYGVWLRRNPWDFAITAGMATMMLVLAAAWDAVRNGIARPAAVMVLGGLAVLAFLDLAGINRGETARLWLFLGVFLQIAAATMCARTTRWWPITVVLAATVLQAAAGAAMIGFVRA